VQLLAQEKLREMINKNATDILGDFGVREEFRSLSYGDISSR